MAEIITTALLCIAGFVAGTMIFVGLHIFVDRVSDYLVERRYGKD